MGRFEDYPGLVGTGVQLLENRLGATPQGFESLPLRQTQYFENPALLPRMALQCGILLFYLSRIKFKRPEKI